MKATLDVTMLRSRDFEKTLYFPVHKTCRHQTWITRRVNGTNLVYSNPLQLGVAFLYSLREYRKATQGCNRLIWRILITSSIQEDVTLVNDHNSMSTGVMFTKFGW